MKKPISGAKSTYPVKDALIRFFRIYDSPQKISLGLGLGVFAGIVPGIGPIAALFLAVLCRANRTAALIGTLLTNTWLSIVTFILSIRIGSAILGLDWKETRDAWTNIFRDFHPIDLMKTSVATVVMPVVLGYLVTALAAGCAAYLVSLAVLTLRKR